MSTVIEWAGQEVTVPPSIRGGVLHIMVRATDEAAFDAAAKQLGLLVEDEERGWIPLRGVTITRIGPIERQAAVLNRLGVEISAAVWDARYHANIWLDARLTALGHWRESAVLWATQGRALMLTEKNRAEDGFVLQGVESIDPDTVLEPVNRLA